MLNRTGTTNFESDRIMAICTRFGQTRPGDRVMGDRGCAINDVSGGLNPRASSFARLRRKLPPRRSLLPVSFVRFVLATIPFIRAATLLLPSSSSHLSLSPISSSRVIFYGGRAALTVLSTHCTRHQSVYVSK